MKKVRIYRGRRTRIGGRIPDTVVTVTEPDGTEVVLNPRFDLRNHSPTGFEWGYLGSGPAQLALALLADVTGDDDLAQRYYQSLKTSLVAAFCQDSWEVTESQVLLHLDKVRREENERQGGTIWL